MEILFFLFWINNIFICLAPDFRHERLSDHVSNEIILVQPFSELVESQVEVCIFHFVKYAFIDRALFLFWDSI